MTERQPRGPDVRQLHQQNLPRVPFPDGRRRQFRVHLSGDAHDALLKHAGENTSVEVCGVLVGQLQQDDDGPYVSITTSIRGEAASNKFAEVTFTHDTWARINKRMDQRHADKAIVGWYHTHPDFGIFLSERDRFIHEHFFNGPGQVAYVVDPVQKIEGFFIWKNGKPDLCPHYWIGNELKAAPTPHREESENRPPSELARARLRDVRDPLSAAPSTPITTGTVGEESAALSIVYKGFVVIAVFVFGWMFGARQGFEDRILAYRGAIDKLHSEGLLKFVTPDLLARLHQAEKSLDAVAADVRQWQSASESSDVPATAGEEPQTVSPEKRAQARATQVLHDTRLVVRDLERICSATAAETEAFNRHLRTLAKQADARPKADSGATGQPGAGSPNPPAQDGSAPAGGIEDNSSGGTAETADTMPGDETTDNGAQP